MISKLPKLPTKKISLPCIINLITIENLKFTCNHHLMKIDHFMPNFFKREYYASRLT